MHEGHRERLRERFIDAQGEGFSDHELLELLLCYAIPQKNLNPLAHELISTFGSFQAVLDAPLSQLMLVQGVGQRTAVLVKLALSLVKRYSSTPKNEKTVLKRRADAYAFCKRLFIGQTTEHFYLVGLDASLTVIGTALLASGGLSEAPADPRRAVQAALAMNAHSVLLTHNHPGGSAAPSQSDLDATEQIADVLSRIGIGLRDHVIVAGEEAHSLSGPQNERK